MKRPQFSLLDLAWTVGLLALAFLGAAVFKQPVHMKMPFLLWVGLIMQAPISFCAGVAAPFRRKLLGALIGLPLGIFGVPSFVVWYIRHGP